MSKPIKLPDPDVHWGLVKKVDKFCERSIRTLLQKIPGPLHYEALRLIADDCYARMEKLETKNEPHEPKNSISSVPE
jgi:hypothetical protein